MYMKKQEKWILGMAIFLLFIDLLVIIRSNLTPKITLVKGNISIALNDSYQEPGYHAKQGYTDITDTVIIKNTIDNQKIGTYDVVYELHYRGKKYQKIRKVTVEDRIAPSIVLNGNNPAIVCPGKEYQEEGYTVTDNYDPNIQEKVKIIKDNQAWIYQVIDQSGNKTIARREMKVEDHEQPTITLTGGNAYSLYLGEEYVDPGYQAFDGCDGNITSKVRLSGTVNVNQQGSYELTYIVSDSAGNIAKETRTVVVLGPRPSNGKIIYLTFDDGPSANITPQLLDILKEENVPATFFVLNHSSSLDYLIKREYEEGHTVALHGSSHNYKQIYSSSTAFWDDMQSIQDKVESITGEKPMIIRFPGGSSNTVSRFNPGIMTQLAKEAKQKGFHYFDWNVGSGDSGEARTADEVYNNVVKSLGAKNNVILMHDFSGNYKTLNAIQRIIQYGKANGYTFAKITAATPEVHHRIAN